MTKFKIRANITYARDLDIEADDFVEAMKKAQEMMLEPIPIKELTPTGLTYDLLSHSIKDGVMVETAPVL